MEGLHPSPNFRQLIEAMVAAIREQMERRLADRDAQIAERVAERQELRRLLTAAQGPTDCARRSGRTTGRAGFSPRMGPAPPAALGAEPEAVMPLPPPLQCFE